MFPIGWNIQWFLSKFFYDWFDSNEWLIRIEHTVVRLLDTDTMVNKQIQIQWHTNWNSSEPKFLFIKQN